MRNKIFKYQKWKFYDWRGKKCSDKGDCNSKNPEIKHWYLWWCCCAEPGVPALPSTHCAAMEPVGFFTQWEHGQAPEIRDAGIE